MYTRPQEEFSHRESTLDPLDGAARQSSFGSTRAGGSPGTRSEGISTVAASLQDAGLAECADASSRPKKIHDIHTAPYKQRCDWHAGDLRLSRVPGLLQRVERKGVLLRPICNSQMQVQRATSVPREDASPGVNSRSKE
jgi:hypothetical protein